MKRRAPGQKTNEKFRQRPAASDCLAIVKVDGAGIRKKIKKDYERALRDLENSRRQLDQFNRTDLPQFTRWLNTHFGALLTELRELGHSIAADEYLVFQVEREVVFGGHSEARAYQRVMEHRDNPENSETPPSSDGQPDTERDSFGSRPEFEDAEDYEDPVEAFLGLFGEFARGEKRGPRAGQDAEPAEPSRPAMRLKDLYRAVARLLHPDSRREITAAKTEWWHQAQAAYEAGDADQLEVILTLCEIDENGTTAHTSASLLQRITAQLKSSLREIKRQLKERRCDPAWNFSQRADHDTLAVRMRLELTGDLERMRCQSRTLQEMIAQWKAAAERRRQPSRRKP